MKKGYAILGRDKSTGKIYGSSTRELYLTDQVDVYFAPIIKKESFTKSRDTKWHEQRRIERIASFHKTLKNKVHYLNRTNSGFDFFITRVGSKNCPIKIKWRKYYEELAREKAVERLPLYAIFRTNDTITVEFSKKTP